MKYFFLPIVAAELFFFSFAFSQTGPEKMPASKELKSASVKTLSVYFNNKFTGNDYVDKTMGDNGELYKTYTYDARGLAVEIIEPERFVKNPGKKKQQFKYDGKNNLIEEKTIEPDTSTAAIHKYYYDEKGNRIKQEYLSSIFSLSTPMTTTYKFDAQNHLIEGYQAYMEGWEGHKRFTYRYKTDEKGNVTDESEYQSVLTAAYENGKANYNKLTEDSAVILYRNSTLYYPDGKIKETNHTGFDEHRANCVRYEHIIKYDEKGNMIAEESEFHNCRKPKKKISDSLAAKTIYVDIYDKRSFINYAYEYDPQGRVIKQTKEEKSENEKASSSAMQWEYNDRGLISKETYLNESGQPRNAYIFIYEFNK